MNEGSRLKGGSVAEQPPLDDRIRSNSTQSGLDADCVALFSAPPFEYSDELLERACSNVTEEDFDTEDNDTDTDTDTTTDIEPAASITTAPPVELNTAPADLPGGAYYLESNNSALLNGPVFGFGDANDFALVRPLAFDVAESDADLELLELRSYASNAEVHLLGIVQNTGTTVQCSVELSGIAEYSTDGELMNAGDSDNFALALGGVGSSAGDSATTDTCLAPGSLGYLHDQQEGFWSTMAEIHADNLGSSVESADHELSTASVIPLSYTLGSLGGDVLIANQHSARYN